MRGKRTREYRIWAAMKTRCGNPRQASWARYGGRGIRVCERWLVFENFLVDMGPCPPRHAIDRIDNNGNYEPGNCRWATYRENSHNSTTVKLVVVQGRRVPLVVAAGLLGVNRTLLTRRIASGLTPQEAVDWPVNHNRSHGVRAGWARKKKENAV